MKTKKNISFVVVLSIVSVLAIVLLIVFEEHLFALRTPFVWSLCLIAGLFFFEIATMLIVDKKMKGSDQKQIAYTYMILKGLKIFLFLFIVVLYFMTVKIEVRQFVLAAVVIYFVYLVLDTMWLYAIEKEKKKEKIK